MNRLWVWVVEDVVIFESLGSSIGFWVQGIGLRVRSASACRFLSGPHSISHIPDASNADTSVLISLAAGGQFRLLRDLYTTI